MIITPLLIVFLALVGVLLFLFLNTIDKRKWLTILITVVITPLVYFFMFYPFLNIISSYHHQKKFNSDAWRNKPSLRYEMIKDIKSSDTLMHLSRGEVVKLLGSYEWLGWSTTRNTHNPNVWNYVLGVKPGAFNTKKECLEIYFTKQKVTRIKHYQDTVSYDL